MKRSFSEEEHRDMKLDDTEGISAHNTYQRMKFQTIGLFVQFTNCQHDKAVLSPACYLTKLKQLDMDVCPKVSFSNFYWFTASLQLTSLVLRVTITSHGNRGSCI